MLRRTFITSTALLRRPQAAIAASLTCATTIPTISAYRYSSSLPTKIANIINEDDINPLIIGNKELGVKDPEMSVCTLTDIVGSDFSVGSADGGARRRLPAGKVLGMMDLCGVRTCMAHITGQRVTAPEARRPNNNNNTAVSGQNNNKSSISVPRPLVSVATVAADNTTFEVPLLNGDAVTVRATAVHVGSSSIGVHLEVFRIQFPTRELMRVSNSFFTYVAINKDLSKANVVPALELTTPRQHKLNKVYKQGIEVAKQTRQESERLRQYLGGDDGNTNSDDMKAKIAELETEINAKKTSHIPMSQTRTQANRIFFPAHLNFNNTIFGGEIMRWMEQHARHCGCMFTGNRNMTTIGMHSVTFSHPIQLNDWVTLETCVTYVHNSTIEVDVTVRVERTHDTHDNSNTVLSNKASFVLINLDEIGQRRTIPTGLRLEAASKGELLAYAEAKYRYQLSLHLRAQNQLAGMGCVNPHRGKIY